MVVFCCQITLLNKVHFTPCKNTNIFVFRFLQQGARFLRSADERNDMNDYGEENSTTTTPSFLETHQNLLNFKEILQDYNVSKVKLLNVHMCISFSFSIIFIV